MYGAALGAAMAGWAKTSLAFFSSWVKNNEVNLDDLPASFGFAPAPSLESAADAPPAETSPAEGVAKAMKNLSGPSSTGGTDSALGLAGSTGDSAGGAAG